MFQQTTERGFTFIELTLILAILGIFTAIGIGTAQQYKQISEKTHTEADIRVILRGLQDDWLAGNVCSGTMPAGLPTVSAYATAYNVNCYKNAFGVTVDVPINIAALINLPNKVVSPVNASTLRLSVSRPAPFIGDGGFVKRNAYLQ